MKYLVLTLIFLFLLDRFLFASAQEIVSDRLPVSVVESESSGRTLVHLMMLHARHSYDDATPFERESVLVSQGEIFKFLLSYRRKTEEKPVVFIEGITSISDLRRISEKCRDKVVEDPRDPMDAYLQVVRDGGSLEQLQEVVARFLFTYGAGLFLACKGDIVALPAETAEARSASLHVMQSRQVSTQILLDRLLTALTEEEKVLARKAIFAGMQYGEYGVIQVTPDPRFLALYQQYESERRALVESKITYDFRERAMVQLVDQGLEATTSSIGFILLGRAHSLVRAVEDHNADKTHRRIGLLTYDFSRPVDGIRAVADR